MSQGPPTPVCQTFLVCKQIFMDDKTQECTLVSPVHQVFAPSYPTTMDLSFFARWSNARGPYRVELQLRDLDEVVLWRDELPQPFEAPDPLRIVPLTLRHRRVRFPRPGKFEFALLANGQEVIKDVFLAHRCEPDPD
jgi:hypothetical protein